MSAGRASEGSGCISWWGLSPALDLLSTGPERRTQSNNVLLVGSSDPRHILKTISALKDGENLHVWLIESSLDMVARQLLLIFLALVPQHRIGLHEKTEVYLEVFGNSEIRSQTLDTLRQAATQLSLSLTDSLDSVPHPCLNTTLLKFRERDDLTRIFKLWTRSSSSPSPEAPGPVLMSRAWDSRVRQHLGTRYDSRRGSFDWDLTMKLHQRGCDFIQKPEYIRWRERGLAFELREGVYEETNPTLLSWRVFSRRGTRVTVRGYWGDIVSGPFLCFSQQPEDNNPQKTHNPQHIKMAQDICFANVQQLLQFLTTRQESEVTPSADPDPEPEPEPDLEPHPEPETEPEPDLEPHADPGPEQPASQPDLRSITIKDLLKLRGVSVTFFPLDSLQKLTEKQAFAHFFSTLYFSASSAHHFAPDVSQILTPDAAVIAELATFVLDLSKEQESGFAQRVEAMAADAGFEPWTNQSAGHAHHAVFVPQKKTTTQALASC